MSMHRPGPPPEQGPTHLFCHLGHTTLDDGLELHVVVDVGVGGRGLHTLQPGLEHWGRRDRRACVGVWPAMGFLSPAIPTTHQSPCLPHRLPAGAPPASSSCCPSSGSGIFLEGGGQLLWRTKGGAPPTRLPSGPRSPGLAFLQPRRDLSLCVSICLCLYLPIVLSLCLHSSAGPALRRWPELLDPHPGSLGPMPPGAHPRHIGRRL